METVLIKRGDLLHLHTTFNPKDGRQPIENDRHLRVVDLNAPASWKGLYLATSTIPKDQTHQAGYGYYIADGELSLAETCARIPLEFDDKDHGHCKVIAQKG